MEVTAVVERVERIGAARVDVAGDRSVTETALVEVRRVRAWLDAAEADLVRSLAEQVSFPESAIAATSRGTLGSAGKTLDRAATLDAVTDLASALDRGDVTAGHVDAVTRAGAALDESHRAEFHDRVAELVDRAASDTIERFGRRVRELAKDIERSDGIDRFERQRRATSVSTWVDREGMWNLRGRFDPLTGVRLAARLDDAVEALFAEATPDGCPGDPVAKQQHLRALALARLVGVRVGAAEGDEPDAATTVGATGAGVGPARGRPEYVVVVDATSDRPNGPTVDWSIPVEVPWAVLAELAGEGEVHAVVVRNGVVLHAPGRLNLGRTTRLANRAQRRALRGLYATCAIPGCTTHYDRCKLHHVIWWRHGGRTDLDNLLPLCVHHHTKVHRAGWELTLGPNRELTLRLPDGSVHNTGPPTRRAA